MECRIAPRACPPAPRKVARPFYVAFASRARQALRYRRSRRVVPFRRRNARRLQPNRLLRQFSNHGRL
jgi:hypothetical protein